MIWSWVIYPNFFLYFIMQHILIHLVIELSWWIFVWREILFKTSDLNIFCASSLDCCTLHDAHNTYILLISNCSFADFTWLWLLLQLYAAGWCKWLVNWHFSFSFIRPKLNFFYLVYFLSKGNDWRGISEFCKIRSVSLLYMRMCRPWCISCVWSGAFFSPCFTREQKGMWWETSDCASCA